MRRRRSWYGSHRPETSARPAACNRRTWDPEDPRVMILTGKSWMNQEKMVIFTGCWHSEPAKRWFLTSSNQPAESGTKKWFKGNSWKHHQITAETHQIDPNLSFQMGDQPIESNRVSNVSKRSMENSARTKKQIPTPRHRSKALQAQGMFISPTPTSAASKQLQQGASHLLGVCSSIWREHLGLTFRS